MVTLSLFCASHSFLGSVEKHIIYTVDKINRKVNWHLHLSGSGTEVWRSHGTSERIDPVKRRPRKQHELIVASQRIAAVSSPLPILKKVSHEQSPSQRHQRHRRPVSRRVRNELVRSVRKPAFEVRLKRD